MNNMRFWKDSSKAVTYTFLGVSTDDAEQGVKIINVTKESAAEKAGLQKMISSTPSAIKKLTDLQDCLSISVP